LDFVISDKEKVVCCFFVVETGDHYGICKQRVGYKWRVWYEEILHNSL